MKLLKIKNRKARLIIAALSVITTMAFADTHWYCNPGSACGTEQKADISNGCLAITCPKRETCTTEDGDANNCTPGFYTAQCEGWQYNGDHIHPCALGPKDAGPEPGGTTCASCVIN